MTIMVCVTAGVPASTLAARGTPPRPGTGPVTRPTEQLGRHDTAALAVAVRLAGDDQVVAVSVGGPDADATLRVALAHGCTRAVRVGWSGELDAPTVAGLLAGVVEDLPSPVTVVTGLRGSAWETGQVPGLLAARLGVPQVAGVTDVDGAGSGLACHWDSATGRTSATVARAAVLSVTRVAANRPAVPSLHATVAAFTDDIEVVPGAANPVPVPVLTGSRVAEPARRPERFGQEELDKAASAVATRLLHHYVGR